MMVDLNPGVAEGLADVFIPISSGGAPASLTQLRQYIATAQAGFYLYEEEFDQHALGLMSDSAFASFVRTMRRTMRTPGMRVAWRMVHMRYGDTFAQFIDKIITETPPMPSGDYSSLERWSADIAAELAKAGP
jgi:hypothetical protein